MAFHRFMKKLTPSKDKPGRVPSPMTVVRTTTPLMDLADTSPRTPGLGPPVDPFAMHADPERIRQTFQKFRILIVGRSNAGKTSILQRVCATTDRPEIYNAQGERIDLNVVEGSIDRGEHNIENELIFRSNPYFIFHDSCGFEAGSRDEFNKMRDFVLDRATTSHLNKRIHAIWYCIAVTDYNRPIVAAEEKFFRECDTKKVPVLLLLTKIDTMGSIAYNELKNEGHKGESKGIKE